MIYIKNGLVIDPEESTIIKKDILIKENKIMCIEEDISIDPRWKECFCSDLQTIDASGCMIAPGLVDIHVHFRDPGFTQKEDINSGARAAAAGGFTSVVLMANTKPVVDNQETLEYIMKKGNETAIHVYSCGSVTKGLKGQELTNMKLLKDVGAVGFTDDGIPLLSEEITKEAMMMCKNLGVPISLHEEKPEYIRQSGINAGETAKKIGLEGADRNAEITMVKRDLELALETGAKINLQHISAKESVKMIREAKRKALDKYGYQIIHAEATPHHFSLTEEAVLKYGTNAKMNPPVRTEADRQAILEGIKDETLDLIATDHAPHTKEEKQKEFTEAPSGIIGLETALSLGVTKLVDEKVLSMPELIKRMSTSPSELYGLPGGKMKEGEPADLVIFEPDVLKEYNQFYSKSYNTPFAGIPLKTQVEYTICDGRIAYVKSMELIQ